MRSGWVTLPVMVGACGGAYLAAILALIATRAPLGSPVFFVSALVATLAYVALLGRAWRADTHNRRVLGAAIALALLFRLPMALAPVGADSDMVRYLWDGRVQRHGYNPYAVLPSDPALSGTHTVESAQMPSLRARTPYPPAAQLFFRLVVAVHDSTRAMKLALVACDLLTMLVLWRWLVDSGRSEWLTIAYAWNPLVVLEVAHSGHIDALGALCLVASAYWLTRRRTALATIAFVLAVASKLVPVVLAPLLVGRVRPRDAVLGGALLLLLYIPFLDSSAPALGAVPNVVAYIRFNGPVFLVAATWVSPRFAAALALLVGLAAATVARWRLPASEPGAWAWPMGLALLCAPVVYPWYLLYLTPFLWTRSTLPLLAWCISGLGAYVVWHLSRHGGRWMVPIGVQVFEYGLPLAVCAVLAVRGGNR